MARKTLQTLIGTYPHTAPIKSGAMKSDRIDFAFTEIVPVWDGFKGMIREDRYDVSEMAVVTYLIAKAHGKTIGQICLRWLIQQPMVAAVPRPLEEAHIVEDLDVFDFSLSDDEMRRISALRSRHVRIADPPERAPKWDVETVG